MGYSVRKPALTKSWLLAAVLLVVGLPRLHGEDFDTVLIREAPMKAKTPIAVEVKQEKRKAAVLNERNAARRLLLTRQICYPSLYPNPLAFNMTWVTISDKTIAQVRAQAARQKALARRAALVQRARPNPAAQNAIQQQMRKFLEPMLKTELSFAARTMNLNQDERKKLVADGKAWFEKFLVDFISNQDPNQQQMHLQGLQGVWFGNQRQKTESPRDALRAGVAKLVKDTLPKEKVAAYTDECRKRDEFARQVSVDNLVERIDEKVKLSPDQRKKVAKSLYEQWDETSSPQLEAFALDQSMWPGTPNQMVPPSLTPAQQAVLKRVNTSSGRMFINGGIFGMFGGNAAVFDDIDVETAAEPAEPAENAETLQPEAE